jgi:hypothetical protein
MCFWLHCTYVSKVFFSCRREKVSWMVGGYHMKTTRLLLPFTHGVDVCAIDSALRLATSRDAILVPLALIYVPEGRRANGARLEHMQQSKDFLEAVEHKAARHGVPIERLEVFTSGVAQSIRVIASEMECEGILLFVGGKHDVLLSTSEIKRLMEDMPCKLYILRLHTKEGRSLKPLLRERFSSWLLGRSEQKHELLQVQNWSEREPLPPLEAGSAR